MMRSQMSGSSEKIDPKAELDPFLVSIKEMISRRQTPMLELQNEIDDLEKEAKKLEADILEMLKGFNL